MSQASTPAKICVLCMQDCSNKPRSKDKQGRYTCEECAAKRKTAGGPVAVGAAAVGASKPPAAVPADDEVIPFLEEESVASKPVAVACPNCARPLSGDAVICMGCGFNRQTGRNVTTAMEEAEGGAPAKRKARKPDVLTPLKCKQCGYDMQGLKSLTCPECGTENRLRSAKRERELAESKRIARKAWISPVIMTAVGLGITCSIVAAAEGGPAVVGHLMNFGISLVIGFIVYFVCSLMWIGFDEPIPMTALRLMGAIALGNIGFTLVGLSPIRPMLLWAAPTIVYFLILSHVMEIDYEDAVIVAIITSVIKVFAIAYIMYSLGML